MAASQWCFADFRLDPANACLWRGTQAVALTPKAFDVLHYLVTHPDRLVTKDKLLDAVWPETAISDAVVRVAIGALRKALGDTAQASRYIATVPRRGYRFLVPVTAAMRLPLLRRETPLQPAAPSHPSRRGAIRRQTPLPMAPHRPRLASRPPRVRPWSPTSLPPWPRRSASR